MSDKLRIAIKMADTADALIARVNDAKKGLFELPHASSAAIGIDPMLLSLATELALKAWITLDQGPKTIREHNLARLFSMLKPEQRAKIESEFRNEFPWNSPSLFDPLGKDVGSILEHHADGFVKWRYMHEIEHGSFSLSDMENVLGTLQRLFRTRYTSKKNDPVWSASQHSY